MSNQQRKAAKLSTNPADGGRLDKFFSPKCKEAEQGLVVDGTDCWSTLKTLASSNLARFAATGGLVCLFDLGLIWLFQLVVAPLLAVSFAYLLAVMLHFCLNKWWVFQDAQQVCSHQVGRYVLTVMACWLTTVGVVAGVTALGTEVLVAKLCAIPPTTLLGFVLMRRFVFDLETSAR